MTYLGDARLELTTFSVKRWPMQKGIFCGCHPCVLARKLTHFRHTASSQLAECSRICFLFELSLHGEKFCAQFGLFSQGIVHGATALLLFYSADRNAWMVSALTPPSFGPKATLAAASRLLSTNKRSCTPHVGVATSLGALGIWAEVPLVGVRVGRRLITHVTR